MKIIKLICLIDALIAIVPVEAQTNQPPRWNITLKVVDDGGNPVKDASVAIGYSLPTPLGQEMKSDRITGLTDANGVFVGSHSDTGSTGLGVEIKKSGYYQVNVRYELYDRYTPERWNLSPTWTLKKIIKPIPMYAKGIQGGPPVFNKPVGYDLTAGDWIAPYGKGQMTDIIFDGQLNQKDKKNYDYKLIVRFPNAADGIQEFTVPSTRFPGDGSALRSSQTAPADGYQREVIKMMSRHPGQLSKSDMNDQNRNYYFRVRTVSDGQGNVKSALYGKVYGDFMQFRYFLNPTPNDRDVEFDPQRNFFPKKMQGGISMNMP